MIFIETERLRLRPFEARDLPAFLAYRQDPEVARYQGWSDYTRADAEAFFERQAQTVFGEAETWFQVGIAELGSDALIGDCAVHFLGERQVEVGFTLSSGHQGRGVMTEASRSLLGFLFGELGMHRATATVDTRNEACVRLLERLGFRREGHFLKNVWFKGAWGDEFSYALLGEEWDSPAAVRSSAP